jgi:glycosyltransferase involved in cell wall biosynthesis
VSVVVLTQDEEANLPACLDSLAGFDDVHVLDSGSTDRTIGIARDRGVEVHSHSFRGFGTQRNWAIDHVPAKYPWQLHLDADERMTLALADELAAAANTDSGYGGYRVPSKLIFAGRWLRYAGQYPGYQVRFFHRDRLRFVDHGHGQREETSFPLGTLREPLLHYGFANGVDAWFRKHVGYARREAEQALGPGTSGGRLLSRDPVERRRALKRAAARLPGRYLLRLGYMLFAQGAVFDGWAGVTYAHMIATYEGMIDVYLRLLARGVDPDRLDPLGPVT